LLEGYKGGDVDSAWVGGLGDRWIEVDNVDWTIECGKKLFSKSMRKRNAQGNVQF
jgi:hypothetical protein